MVRHYLSVALLNFRKTPFATLANVAVLALGPHSLRRGLCGNGILEPRRKSLRERESHVRDHQPHGARGRHRRPS